MRRKQILVMLVVSIFLTACSFGDDGTGSKSESQNSIEFNAAEEDTVKQKTDENSEMIAGGERITDEDVISSVESLLLEESAFRFKLSCEWIESIDDEQQYETNDNIYFLVVEEGVSSWEDYENIARNYYTETYINEEFTPYYVPHVYIEQGGNLYRAMADGIGDVLIEDSIEVYERTDGSYYVTILTESDVEGTKNSYILEAVVDAPYGFKIISEKPLIQ